MPQIKVLHIHTLPVISGSGLCVLNTLKGLKQKGYAVEFACSPGGPLIKEVLTEGVPFRPVKHFVQRINIFYDFLALVELVLLILKEKYTIVHTHNSKAGFLGRLAAKITGVPVIVHTIHGFAFHDFEKPSRRALFIVLERFAANLADKLIAVSAPLKKWGLRLKIGKKSQYCVVYTGIEIEQFKINTNSVNINKRKELGLASQDLVVGTVAKLWEGKGHAVILEAATMIIQEFPNVKFLFVGDGYLRQDLERIVLNKGLNDYVKFTGFRTDIPEITSIFDIAVLASFFEGLGRVLLEAMALNKPIVASNVGGIPDIVKNNVNGLLVSPGEPKALAEAIIKLLKSESLRKEMGLAGGKMVTEKFHIDKRVQDIDKIYGEILKKKRKIR
jgi:glycosyltransferase involved in cell wall biosynthesis